MPCPHCRKPLDNDRIGGGLRSGNASQAVLFCEECNLVVIGAPRLRHLELVVDNDRREDPGTLPERRDLA